MNLEELYCIDLEEKIIFSVSDLNRLIKQHIESLFSYIWVEGEISNLRIPTSGHLYFTLKDEKSQIRAVMFHNLNKNLRFLLKDGLKVVCKGKITLYEPRGEYQLIIEFIEPKGRGAFQLAFEQLKTKLLAEGLFKPERKKPLPVLPQKIGIITSITGAALRDILRILYQDFDNLETLIYPVKVQGLESAQEIVKAIEDLNASTQVELIILARGGGSIEDLWTFNDESVARAIASSNIPIVSAIGHEIDFTIADFVADVRAPTPTAAAELIVKNKKNAIETLASFKIRLNQSILQLLDIYKQRCSLYKARLSDPTKQILRFKLTLDELSNSLNETIRKGIRDKKDKVITFHRSILSKDPIVRLKELFNQYRYLRYGLVNNSKIILDKKRQSLQTKMDKLDSLSPLNILKRGYSITRTLPEYHILKKASDISSGKMVNVKLAEGQIECEVKNIYIE